MSAGLEDGYRRNNQPSTSVPRVYVSQTDHSDEDTDPLMRSDPGGIRHGRWSDTTRPRPMAYTMPVRDPSDNWQDKRNLLRRTQTETEIPLAECPVCLEEYDYDRRAPRSLLCGHSFCSRCLREMLRKSSKPQIDCPKCNRVMPVRDRDINNLSKNFALLEILQMIPGHTERDGERASSLPPPLSLKCPEHGDQLTSFCVKDGSLICSSCLVYGSHKNHESLPMPQAAVEFREKLCKLSPAVLGQKKRMEEALTAVDGMIASIQGTSQQLESQVEEKFQELIDLISDKRDQLKTEILARTQIRVETLLEQSKDVSECIEKAAAVHQSAEELIQGDDITLLQGAMLTLDQIEGVFINPPPATPRAKDDLTCKFTSNPTEDIASLITGYGNIRSDVGTVNNLRVESYHDGIRISWDSYDFVDNSGMSYHLQMAAGTGEYKPIFRGSATKFTWKKDLDYNVPYKFRVQVRTPEGVGNWSQPEQALKATPIFHWHNQWRNVKIELSQDKLEAYWSKGKTLHYWATFAGDRFFEKRAQHYCEIEIVEFGKPKPHKKLAIGVIGCTRTEAANLPWQDGHHAVGQLEVKSWSFHPISGVLNSHTLSPEGVSYVPTLEIQNGDRIGMLLDMDTKKLSFFYNGNDLGVAFEDLDAPAYLPAVSILDKIRVRLRFPPPPYYKRIIQVYQLISGGGVLVSTSAPNMSILESSSSKSRVSVSPKTSRKSTTLHPSSFSPRRL